MSKEEKSKKPEKAKAAPKPKPASFPASVHVKHAAAMHDAKPQEVAGAVHLLREEGKEEPFTKGQVAKALKSFAKLTHDERTQ